MTEKLSDLERKKEQMPYLALYMTENADGVVQVNILQINEWIKTLEAELQWYKLVVTMVNDVGEFEKQWKSFLKEYDNLKTRLAKAQELPEKWRKHVITHDPLDDKDYYIPHDEDVRNKCADELEEALK